MIVIFCADRLKPQNMTTKMVLLYAGKKHHSRRKIPCLYPIAFFVLKKKELKGAGCFLHILKKTERRSSSKMTLLLEHYWNRQKLVEKTLQFT